MAKATIHLENMEFRAYHGCYDLEKVVGNMFRVDAIIEAEIGDAAAEDRLDGTINYLTVFEIVHKQMGITSNIIENVASRIIDAIYGSFPNILKVSVTVSKMAPPLGGKIEKVSATLTR